MNKWSRQKTAREIPKCGDQFIEWCTDTNPEPGDIWRWGGNTKTKVLNLIIGEAVDPELVRASRLNKIAVQRAFRTVNKRAVEHRLSSIAMPKIGSGAGGID